MAKKLNRWMAHLAEVRRLHPEVKDVGELAKLAKKTYKPEQKGGAAMGGDLSPSDFTADPKLPTSGTAIQVEATQHSTGGAKKSRKSKAKSHKKSHKKSRKSKAKSHKRH